jgi:hypothetical protein
LFKRKYQAVTLQDKPTIVDIETGQISIDPQLLFQRFIVAADSIYEDKAEIFAYELSSQPSSMFDSSGFMRSAQKSTLVDAIWNVGDCSAEYKENSYNYVVDGGSLMHKIPWQYGSTFGEICQKYVHGSESVIVVFDGYVSGPNTKDATHLRCTKGIFGTKVSFTETTPFRSKKEAFLANSENKQNFILMLRRILDSNGIETKKAPSDADLLPTTTDVQSSITRPTIILGEDTDLLILLLYYYECGSMQLIFRPNHDKKTVKSKIWDIGKTTCVLGQETCKVISVIRAISGCDTTSKLYGVGKRAALKKFMDSQTLKELRDVFLKISQMEDIIKSGERIITNLYRGVPSESLNVLRYKKFATKVATSKEVIQIHTLPPTSKAAVYHDLRVYYQDQIWIGGLELDACEFGWFINNDKMMPIKTKNRPAPEKLLSIIRCNCKTNCET